MSVLKNDILTMDFKRTGKKYAVFAVVVTLLCGGLGLYLLWPQLTEAARLLGQGGVPLEWRLDGAEEMLEGSLAGYSGASITAVSLGARTALLVCGLIVMALAAGYWLLVALWLYQQATQTELGGALWFLLGLAGNLVAVAAFLAVRSTFRVRCTVCDGWSPKSDDYCHHCGASLGNVCPSCGAALKAGAHFCGHCGRSLEDAAHDDDR